MPADEADGWLSAVDLGRLAYQYWQPCGPQELCERFRFSSEQLKVLKREGLPQLKAGRRGRGGEARYDPRAVAAWLAMRRGTAVPADVLRVFAADVPHLVAAAVDASFRAIEGPHKRAMGPVLAAVWYRATTAIQDRLREHVPDIPEIEIHQVPEKIGRLDPLLNRRKLPI